MIRTVEASAGLMSSSYGRVDEVASFVSSHPGAATQYPNRADSTVLRSQTPGPPSHHTPAATTPARAIRSPATTAIALPADRVGPSGATSSISTSPPGGGGGRVGYGSIPSSYRPSRPKRPARNANGPLARPA